MKLPRKLKKVYKKIEINEISVMCILYKKIFYINNWRNYNFKPSSVINKKREFKKHIYKNIYGWR